MGCQLHVFAIRKLAIIFLFQAKVIQILILFDRILVELSKTLNKILQFYNKFFSPIRT